MKKNTSKIKKVSVSPIDCGAPKGAGFVKTTYLAEDNFYWAYFETRKDAQNNVNQLGETHWYK